MSVSGNVGLNYTTSNVLRILDILEAEQIPVFAGARSALVAPGENASFVHGNNGLGNVSFPASNRAVEEEHTA